MLKPAIFVDAYGVALDLARSGAGVALVSSLLASRCLAEGSLVRVRSETLPADDGYFLATRARENELALRFCSWIKSEIFG